MRSLDMPRTEAAIGLAQGSWPPGGAPDPLAREKHGLIGAQISRIDGLLKVTGSAPFAAEFPIDGMVFAALVFSTIAKGRIASLVIADAKSAPGVALVMTHDNAPRLNPAPMYGSSPKAVSGDDLPVMQDDKIHWNGQPVAVVLADTQEQADHAASLILVSYEAEPATTALDDVRDGSESAIFMGEALTFKVGDAKAALAAAPVTVDNVYLTPRHNHNAIELHALTVVWKGAELNLHDASQCVAHTAWTLSQIFGVD